MYPGPVLYSHWAEAKWSKSCQPLWDENVNNYRRTEANSDSLDYVFYGQAFASPWLEARINMNDGYDCFQNLFKDHMQAIERFNANLIEYKRQRDLGVPLLAPNFQYPQYSKVEFLCYAPSIFELRWKLKCTTFLNVP